MDYDDSSANPGVLYHYSDQMDHLTATLFQSVPQLRNALATFISSCTEIPTQVDMALVGRFVHAIQRQQKLDGWVRQVGKAFEAADQLGSDSKMNDLHHVIETLYLSHADGVEYPIKVVRIGPDEYLVLIAGTDTDGVAGSNDWPSNLRTGENMPSEFLRQVRRTMEDAGIPQGANVHLAGHSQGGNVAMVLADTQSFVDMYTIQSISTFGSPPSAPINPRLGQSKYHNYALVTDPVPYTTQGPIAEIATPLAFLIDPLLGLSLRTSTIAPRGQNTVIPEIPKGIMSHSDYKYSDFLKTQDLPFEVTEWTVVNQSAAGPKDGLRLDFDDIMSDDPSRRLTGGFNLFVDVKKHSIVNILQDVTTTLTYRAPEPLRTTVDRGLDWLAEKVTTGPRPSEALETTIRGVADLQTAPYRGGQRVIQGVWDSGRTVIDANITANEQLLQGVAEGDRVIREGVSDGTRRILRGDAWGGGAEIGNSVAAGTARTVEGLVDSTGTRIQGAVDGVSTMAEGVAGGVATTVKGTLEGASNIASGIGNFLF